MNVLVLSGGSSDERDVSLRSGANVAKALQAAGHTVVAADPSAQGFDLTTLAQQVDAIFPILHGKGGEDGTIQEAIEKTGKPYLGSRPAACKLMFDKVEYKKLMERSHLLTPKWEEVDREAFEASALRQKPYVLKPIDGGSSIDMVIAHDPQKTDEANVERVFSIHNRMLLEELIAGQELTVGIVDGHVLPVILIMPPDGQDFDYSNKYNGKSQELVLPTQVPAERQKAAQDLAVTAHHLVGARHISRTDMILSGDHRLYLLETNAIPGLTEQSLLPKAAAALGMDWIKLANLFAELSKVQD